jgi:hypothetical protein
MSVRTGSLQEATLPSSGTFLPALDLGFVLGFSFGGTGVCTEGLAWSRQALYHLSHAPILGILLGGKCLLVFSVNPGPHVC